MLSKRVLIALGGNAITLPKEQGTANELISHISATCDQLAKLVARGHRVYLAHGNGPQVGQIFFRNQKCAPAVPAFPLHVCVAESEGLLGYLFQQGFHNSLCKLKNNLSSSYSVVTLVTQTQISPTDVAFSTPNKPIGSFFTESEAKEKMAANPNQVYKEDTNRGGWRLVVPSPKPVRIIEAEALRALCELPHTIVIASGGGGIPVLMHPKDCQISGVDAVVDKDFAAVLMAKEVKAEMLVLVTDVEYAYEDFGQAHQAPLRRLCPASAARLLAQGSFGEGSMSPKVRACLDFVCAEGKPEGDRAAVITSMEHVVEVVEGNQDIGTWVTALLTHPEYIGRLE